MRLAKTLKNGVMVKKKKKIKSLSNFWNYHLIFSLYEKMEVPMVAASWSLDVSLSGQD